MVKNFALTLNALYEFDTASFIWNFPFLLHSLNICKFYQMIVQMDNFLQWSFLFTSEVPAVSQEKDKHQALTWSVPFPLSEQNFLESRAW